MSEKYPNRFKKGHAPTKPKGAISKSTVFKNFLLDNFQQNRDKAKQRLNELYDSKEDFLRLMNLLANFCPKQIENSDGSNIGSIGILVKEISAGDIRAN